MKGSVAQMRTVQKFLLEFEALPFVGLSGLG